MVFIVFIGTVFSALIKSGLRRLIDRSLFRYVLRKVDVSHSNNEKSSLLSYDFLMASNFIKQQDSTLLTQYPKNTGTNHHLIAMSYPL